MDCSTNRVRKAQHVRTFSMGVKPGKNELFPNPSEVTFADGKGPRLLREDRGEGEPFASLLPPRGHRVPDFFRLYSFVHLDLGGNRGRAGWRRWEVRMCRRSVFRRSFASRRLSSSISWSSVSFNRTLSSPRSLSLSTMPSANERAASSSPPSTSRGALCPRHAS